MNAALTFLRRALLFALQGEPAYRTWNDEPVDYYPISNCNVVDPDLLAELESCRSDEELRQFIGHPAPGSTGPELPA